MTPREELELILNLLRKYDLPLSPILEYAIREKQEEYPDENNDDLENNEPKNVNVSDALDVNDTVQEEKISSGDRRGRYWTRDEEEMIVSFFEQGKDFSSISDAVGRTIVAVKSRLAKLGLIDYVYGQDEVEEPYVEHQESVNDNKETIEHIIENDNDSTESDFAVENYMQDCYIFDNDGKKVFADYGKLKFIKGKLYLFYYMDHCYTVRSMTLNNGIWRKGDRRIVADSDSKLYAVLQESPNYIYGVEDIRDCSSFEDCEIKIYGSWYNCYGCLLDLHNEKRNEITDDEGQKKKKDLSSQFSVKIGDKLRIFPSQSVGKVIRLYVNKSGQRMIGIKLNDGKECHIYDSKYLYQKINVKKARVEKIVDEESAEDASNEHITKNVVGNSSRKYAVIGCWIQWKPTGEIGKVTSFFREGQVRKMIIRTKSGIEKVVYDNPSAYDVVFDRGDSRAPDISSSNTSPSVRENESSLHDKTKKKIRVGDRIKIKNYNTSCKVIRIERFAASFTKLIVEFDDGRQDWILNNPDLFTIL